MKNNDFFGKLDDILYMPVKLVADYLTEPLNAIHAGRERKNAKYTAEIEMQHREQKARLDKENAERMAELETNKQKQQAEIALNAAETEMKQREQQALLKRVNAEYMSELVLKEKEHEAMLQKEWREFDIKMNELIAEQEENRCNRMVESLKRYQLDLANAMKDIVEDISSMSFELRVKADNLVQEKNQEYIMIQRKALSEYAIQIKETEEMFKDDKETFQQIKNVIIEGMSSIIDKTNKLMNELQEGIHSINETNQYIIKTGMDNINKNITSMASSLRIGSNHTPLLDNSDKIIDVIDLNEN